MIDSSPTVRYILYLCIISIIYYKISVNGLIECVDFVRSK